MATARANQTVTVAGIFLVLSAVGGLTVKRLSENDVATVLEVTASADDDSGDDDSGDDDSAPFSNLPPIPKESK